MRKINQFASLSLIVVAMAYIFYSCDNPTNNDPVYKGIIKGWVYDDSTKAPIQSVKVWADGIPDSLVTDVTGMFNFTRISMPRGEFTYYLIFQRPGYNDKSLTVFIKSDREYKIDSVFLHKSF